MSGGWEAFHGRSLGNLPWRIAQPVRTATTTAIAPAAALPAVPNVVGEDEKTARRELSDAGFRVQVEHELNGGHGKGKEKGVVSQNPGPGSHAQTGTKVIIYVGRPGHEGD